MLKKIRIWFFRHIFRQPICGGCACLIDPEWCWCGGKIDQHYMEGHAPVEMGCVCGYEDKGNE